LKTAAFYRAGLIICSGSILLLLISSLVYNLLPDNDIPQMLLLRDDNGRIIGDAPFAPSWEFPFGTDREGFDIGYKLLEGAIYTIGAAITISLLCFIVAFGIGIIGGFSKFRVKSFAHKFFTSFYFIPQSIIAYNILYPVIWEPMEGFTTTLSERIVIEVLVLAIITVPTTSILISNETEQILSEEFITSARVLGGSPLFIFYKHVLPHLKMRLFIIYPKIVIQVLLIIAHLGFFTLYFGGTDVCYTPFCHPPKPFIQEWSGMLGTSYKELGLSWWIFMGPLMGFTVTILLLNGITKCMEGLFDHEPYNSKQTFLEDETGSFESDSDQEKFIFIKS
jgi:peptide/nickel transport system permease protein